VCQGQIFNRVEELLTPDKKSVGLRFSTRRNIVCPWHGYEFDIETGCHQGDRAVRLKPVKVDVREGQIFIGLTG
jgi:nitrite reductase/ring-hydroxylating ferredoxin subunit